MGKTFRHVYDEDDYYENEKKKLARRRLKKKLKNPIDSDLEDTVYAELIPRGRYGR